MLSPRMIQFKAMYCIAMLQPLLQSSPFDQKQPVKDLIQLVLL